jgi:hypothetical protein
VLSARSNGSPSRPRRGLLTDDSVDLEAGTIFIPGRLTTRLMRSGSRVDLEDADG